MFFVHNYAIMHVCMYICTVYMHIIIYFDKAEKPSVHPSFVSWDNLSDFCMGRIRTWFTYAEVRSLGHELMCLYKPLCCAHKQEARVYRELIFAQNFTFIPVKLQPRHN